MNLLLKNKHVFISGSSSGVGYAIAKGFAREGAIVYLNGRNADKVESAVSRIRDLLPDAQVHGIAADLTMIEGYEKVTRILTQVDILINNLGLFEPVSFFESKEEDWLKLFNINIMSGMRLTRFYMPKMHVKNWGRVVFISCEPVSQIPTETIPNDVLKTAQLSLANSLAQLTKGTEVTINAVLPGPTYSEGVKRLIEDLAKQRKSTIQETERQYFAETRPFSVLQRFITPEEVAATVMLVSSELGAGTNGAAVRVDGGIPKGL